MGRLWIQNKLGNMARCDGQIKHFDSVAQAREWAARNDLTYPNFITDGTNEYAVEGST